MQITIDSAGRLVVPKILRDAAGLLPDMPVEVSYRDGHIEIAPAPRLVRIVKNGHVAVARPEQRSLALSPSVVDHTRRKLRDR